MKAFSLRLSGKTKALIYFSISTLLLFTSFQNNTFSAADERWFESHQNDSESLVVGRVIKSEQDGVFSAGGKLGRYEATRGNIHEYQNHLLEGRFVANTPFHEYKSQIGGQGIFFSLINSVFNKIGIAPNQKLEYFHQINSLLSATVLAIIATGILLLFGFIPSTIVLVSLIFAQWLIVFGDNLYWVIWTIFAPTAASLCFVVYSVKKDKPINIKVLSTLMFLLVLIRCSAGFEYISTILISSFIPLIYIALIKRWSLLKFVVKTTPVGLAAIFAFIFANLIHVTQISISEQKSFSQALNERLTHAKSRTHINEANYHDDWWREAATVPIGTVLHMYWSGKAYELDNFTPLTNFKEINFYDLIYILIVLSCLSGLSGRYSRHIKASRSTISALTISAWVSLLGPISWYTLAKVHSYGHGHMNHFLWHVTTTIWIAALLGLLSKLAAQTIFEKLKPLKVLLLKLSIVATTFVIFSQYNNYKNFNLQLSKLSASSIFHTDLSNGISLNILDSSQLALSVENCKALDTSKKFFVHFHTNNPEKSVKAIDFYWSDKSIARGLAPIFGNKSCLAKVPLPIHRLKSVRIGQFDGPRIWEKLINIDIPMEPSEMHAFNLTDGNWVNGISRGREAKFFTKNSILIRQALHQGDNIHLPYSGNRVIRKITYSPQYINITVSGDRLNPEKDGYPHLIKLNNGT